MQQKLEERVTVSLSISNQAATYTADLNSCGRDKNWDGGWYVIMIQKCIMTKHLNFGHVCLKGIVPKVMGFAQMQEREEAFSQLSVCINTDLNAPDQG